MDPASETGADTRHTQDITQDMKTISPWVKPKLRRMATSDADFGSTHETDAEGLS